MLAKTLTRLSAGLVTATALATPLTAQSTKTSPSQAHPFIGKTCIAPGSAIVQQGNYTWTGNGKYDLFFGANGTVKVKWTGDDGRVSGGTVEVPFIGLEDRFYVCKSERGGVLHVDARAGSGTVRVGYIYAQFRDLKCK